MIKLINAIKDALAANDVEAATKARTKAQKHLDEHPMSGCFLTADDVKLIEG